MTDFDQSTNFLLEYFPKLPDDIILLITEQLPLEYVIDWLIKNPDCTRYCDWHFIQP